MAVRRSWLVLAVLLVPAVARAGDHKIDVLVAPSYLRTSGSIRSLGGWHVSGAATVSKHRWLSLIGDLSVHFLPLDDDKRDLTQITFMAGPRFTIPGPHHHMPFVHLVVLGAVHRDGGSQVGGTSAGVLAGGAGYDFAPGGNLNWATRFQVDYILPVSSDLKHSWRFSAGALYRFK